MDRCIEGPSVDLGTFMSGLAATSSHIAYEQSLHHSSSSSTSSSPEHSLRIPKAPEQNIVQQQRYSSSSSSSSSSEPRIVSYDTQEERLCSAFPLLNLRHPPDFKPTNSRRGTLHAVTTCRARSVLYISHPAKYVRKCRVIQSLPAKQA